MSDDVDKKQDSPPASDDAASKPDGKTLEELQKELDALKKDRDDWKGRFESDKAERDAAKKKAREEAERARKKLEEDGEHEKVIAALKAELEDAKPKAEQFESLKAERDAMLEERKAELLARLPEDQRGEWKDADLTTLTKLVKTIASQPNIPGTHNGAGTPKGGAKAWGDMSITEKSEYMATHSSEDVQAKIRAWRAGK